MTAPDRRIDDLREQLRALGYLDARVDRFVLGGAAERGAAGLALMASLRIGLLAGLLLGPAAVVGLRLRAPALVTSLSDALVLTAYLTVLFAVATAVVAGAGILAGRGLARRAGPARARRLAAAAGLGVAVPSFIYLVLWWRAADPVSGLALLPTAAVAAVAAGISLLLGHAVTVTVLAWLARSGLGPSLGRGLPLSSPVALVGLGLVGIASGITLLAITRTDAAPPPELVVVPTGERVLVLAIDGVDPDTVRRLDAAGQLPVLGPILGPTAVTMPSHENRDPARVWTTIATGQPAERHGIASLESRQLAGVEGQFRTESPWWTSLTAATDLLRLTRPAVTAGSGRRSPTFWEVAARAGLRTAVVHWWATWPAAPDQGVVLTDRAMLRLEHGGALDGEIAPDDLYDALRQTWPERRRRAARVADQALGEASLALAAGVADAVGRAAELDATLVDLAGDSALGPLDLLVLYLPGLDIVQQTLLGDVEGSMTPTATVNRVASVEAYYRFLDRALAALVAPSEASRGFTLVIGVSQPGRVSAEASGLLGLSGTAAGAGDPDIAPTAVAATVLYALGVPVASDLASPPALELFGTAFVERHAPREVTTYGPVRLPPRTGSGRALDQEMIERMRSLGYLR